MDKTSLELLRAAPTWQQWDIAESNAVELDKARAQCYEYAAQARDSEYYKWRLTEIMPLFEEARDALTSINMTQVKLHGLSLSLADRMDQAGTRTRAEFDALAQQEAA